jgi:hypothetical protein
MPMLSNGTHCHNCGPYHNVIRGQWMNPNTAQDRREREILLIPIGLYILIFLITPPPLLWKDIPKCVWVIYLIKILHSFHIGVGSHCAGIRIYTCFGDVLFEGRFTLWPNVEEAIHFHQSNCKKPRIWPLDPSHYMLKSKGCRKLKSLHGNIFWPRRWTLKGSLGRTWMKTQTTIERPSILLYLKKYWQIVGRKIRGVVLGRE